MSVSMLLNTDDGPTAADKPLSRRDRDRDRDPGRIPINSLLSTTTNATSSRHNRDTHYSNSNSNALHRQSSMYADRRAASSSTRAPLPSFASLHQSFHYAAAAAATNTASTTADMNDPSHHNRTSSSSTHHYQAHNHHYRRANMNMNMNTNMTSASPSVLHHRFKDDPHHSHHSHHLHPHRSSATAAAAVLASGKSLTRTKSVPYVTSPLSKNSTSTATDSLLSSGGGNGAGGGGAGGVNEPKSPSSSASSSHQNQTNPPRRRWKPWEDQLLIQLVSEQGPQRWNTIAQGFPGRNGRQVRLRWMNHLQPSLDKRLWRPEEDAILLAAHKELGNKWAHIAMRLHGRTDNSVKNRYKSIARRAARSTGQGGA